MSLMHVDYFGLNQIYSFAVIISSTNKYRKHKSGMLIWVIPISIDYFRLCPSQTLYASGLSYVRHKLFMHQDHLMSVTNCLCTSTVLWPSQTVYAPLPSYVRHELSMHRYHLMFATNSSCTVTFLRSPQTVHHYRLMSAQTVYAPVPSSVRYKLFMHHYRLVSVTNC